MKFDLSKLFFPIVGFAGIILVLYILTYGYGFNFLPLPNLPVINNTETFTLRVGQKYPISKIKVVEGHLFDISSLDNKRYIIWLNGASGSPPEAKDEVVKILNYCLVQKTPIFLVPRRWNDNRKMWEGDIYFQKDGTNMTLTELLLVKNLLYSQ